MTEERRQFNRLIKELASRTTFGTFVYDIGVSTFHGAFMEEAFNHANYETIDNDIEKNPRHLMDVEDFDGFFCAGVVICNGVFEQTNNPFKLAEGVYRLVRNGGTALFGIMSIGYPLYSTDYVRFTPAGARRLLSRCGFIIGQELIVYRQGNPSYLFYECIKPKKEESCPQID